MKIKKVQLDTLISMNRGYWKEWIYDASLATAKCRAMFLHACKTFGVDWGMTLQELIGGILKHQGLKPDATNEDIYKVLEVLGHEVTE